MIATLFIVGEPDPQIRAGGKLTDEHVFRRAADGDKVPRPVRAAARVCGGGGDFLRFHPTEGLRGSLIHIPCASWPEWRAEQPGGRGIAGRPQRSDAKRGGTKTAVE